MTRVCRECHRPLDPGSPPHYWAHRSCYFQALDRSSNVTVHVPRSRRAAPDSSGQIRGQLSLLDTVEAEPAPAEDSEFLAWLASQEAAAV